MKKSPERLKSYEVLTNDPVMAWLLVFEGDKIALHFTNFENYRVRRLLAATYFFLVSTFNVRRSEITSAVVLHDIKY